MRVHRVKVAFTGTRRGMTGHQRVALGEVLGELAPCDFHHGGARGADTQAHQIARELGCEVHVWLPEGGAWRGGGVVHATHLPPLRRNDLIIAGAQQLIAAPAQAHEVLRSGTWATVRHARQAGIDVVVLAP